jgi:GTP-binding protein
MIIKSARFVISAQAPKDFPKDGLPHIAVGGRSNVGKSSLLNFLVGQKHLVKTSGTPGKTRLINFFLINEQFYFVDIPGFGYAKAGRELKQQMTTAIDEYFSNTNQVAGLLYLVDSRLPDSPVDAEALEWLAGFGFRIQVLATKGDKLGKEETKKALAEITRRHKLPQPPILTSSLRKQGREEVLEQLDLLLASDEA